MPPSVEIPPGVVALPMLLESLAQFYDSSVVEMLVKRGTGFKGSEEDKNDFRDHAMATMIKLMKKEQIGIVESAINNWNPKPDDARIEKAAFKRSKDLLLACGDQVECYLARIEDPAVQEREEQFTGIKAAYMLGVFGNDATRAQIVSRLPRIKNVAIKFAAAQALDQLAPNGDKPASDQIAKIIESNRATGDRILTVADAVLIGVLHRLQARL